MGTGPGHGKVATRRGCSSTRRNSCSAKPEQDPPAEQGQEPPPEQRAPDPPSEQEQEPPPEEEQEPQPELKAGASGAGAVTGAGAITGAGAGKPLAVQQQPPWLRPVQRQPLQQQPPQQPPAPPLPLAGRNRPRTAASTALHCRPGGRNTASWSSCRRCVSAGQLAGQLPCVLPQGIQLLALLPQALVTGGLAMFCAFDAPSNPHRKPCFACCDVGHFVIQPKKRPPAAKASSATVVHRVRMVFSGWISSEEEEVARSAE